MTVVSILQVFNITPPVESQGQPVKIEPKMTTGTFSLAVFRDINGTFAHAALLADILKPSNASLNHVLTRLSIGWGDIPMQASTGEVVIPYVRVFDEQKKTDWHVSRNRIMSRLTVICSMSCDAATPVPATVARSVSVQNDDPLIHFHGRWDSTPETWWYVTLSKIPLVLYVVLAISAANNRTLNETEEVLEPQRRVSIAFPSALQLLANEY